MIKLHGCNKDSKAWEEWEDNIIRNNYGKLSYDKICSLLPNRTNQSVQHRRRKLGINSIHKELVTREKWTEAQEMLLLDNLHKLTLKEIANLVGKPLSSISSKIDKLKKKGRLTTNKFDRILWSAEEDQLLLDYYDRDVNYILTLLPHRTKKAIHHRWRFLKPDIDKREQRIHSVDMDFFSTPNILNSYWAGFIAADGCLTEKKHLFSIGLQARDGYHLEQLAKDVGYSGKVSYTTPSNGYAKASMYIWGVKQWFLDLEKHFTITPRKSLTLEPPQIVQEDLIISFIRGLIDGDGSIALKSGKTWCVTLAGTFNILQWICDYFDGVAPPRTASPARPWKHANIFGYRVSGKRAVYILDRLCSVDTPFLKRKWEPVFKEFSRFPL